MKRRKGWKAVRLATLSRDGQVCRKCGSSSGLEAHHIVERSQGGLDHLDNLITLCSDCHNEWTFFEPPAEVMTFALWMTVPPGRYLVAAFAREWPADQSAADYKRAIEETIKLARRSWESSKP